MSAEDSGDIAYIIGVEIEECKHDTKRTTQNFSHGFGTMLGHKQ